MIVVLLPAYNEEAALRSLVEKIDTALADTEGGYWIVVCDDGSTDATPKVLEELLADFPIEVIRHKINRGLGETVRDLFERAAEITSPEDRIVRMDCDATHGPEVIETMLRRLDDAACDVVIASRFQSGGGQVGVATYRAFISSVANIVMKIFFPIKDVREYSCGFRAYRANIIHEAINIYGNNFIQIKGLGFTCTLEKLVKLRLLGARFAEVPFVLRYDLKDGESKMITNLTTLGYIVMTVMYHWPFGGWRVTYANRKGGIVSRS